MKSIRISILATVIALLAVGTVMIYSASGVYAYEKFGDSLFFLKRHLMFLCIGAVFSFAVLAVDPRFLQKHSKALLLASLVFLILVLIPGIGSEISGARRWFRFGNFSFQPSELMKLTLIVYLADVLARKGPEVNDIVYGFLPPLAVSGLTMALVLVQPDLGTAIAMGCIVFVMFFAAGIKKRYLGSVLAASIPILFLAIWKVPYRLRRMAVFFNPCKFA